MNRFYKIQSILGITLLSLFMISCDQLAKDKPTEKLELFERQDKFDVLSKSRISAGVDHIMMVSNVGTDRNSDEISHYVGYEGIVRLIFEKDSITIVEAEKDSQFSDNPLNNKVVGRIPVTYIDKKCAEDAYGECTNKEILDEDKAWDEKAYIKPDFSKTKMEMLDELSLSYSIYYANAFNKTSSQLVNYKIEDGVINITLKETYSASADHLGPLADKEEMSFSNTTHYSLVALDQLASPGYQALVFQPEQKENQFGFFRTSTKTLSSSNIDTVEGNKELQERWSPNKSTVVYYMNEDFDKVDPVIPHLNQKIKESTRQGFKMINLALEQAGSKLRLELREPSKDIIPGDLRNSELIMVSDPIKKGLLGYGPSVANPKTGEILYARTVMYKGIMKKTIEGAWNDVVKLKSTQKKEQENAQKSPPPAQKNNESLSPQDTKALAQNWAEKNLNGNIQNHKVQELANMVREQALRSPAQHQYNSLAGTFYHQNQVSLFNQPESFEKVLTENREKQLMETYSKNNIFTVENFNFHGVVEDHLNQLVEEFGGLKSWQELSKAQQNRAIEVLLPIVWIPTLIHEVGHNLGLRHNFQGSFDKANWYTKEELASMNIHRPITYSSIMDYGYATHNELPVMGKYDVAALRFAYGQVSHPSGQYTGAVEVNLPTKDGNRQTHIFGVGSPELKQALEQQGAELKPYMFCTDENVSASATCNRFDEGTTLLEVVDHTIKAYHENYSRRNLRNGRYDFNNFTGDVSYAVRMMGTFDNLRLTFENYETIKNKFSINEDSEEWDNDDFLKEVKEAMLKSGQFFLEVLKTPDTHCKVLDQQTEQEIIAPLQSISKFSASCYDIDLNPRFKILAQAGKSFRSIKDRKNPDASIIAIDTRGIWIDKLLALNYLLDRRVDVLDEYQENYTDVAELKDSIYNTLRDIIMDQHEGTLSFDDGTISESRVYSLLESEQSIIREPLHSGIRRFFGLERKSTLFQEAALKYMGKQFEFLDKSNEGLEFKQLFTVLYDVSTASSQLPKDAPEVTIGEYKFSALQHNQLAKELILAIKELPEIQNYLAEFMKVPDVIQGNPAAEALWRSERVAQLVAMIETRSQAPDNMIEPPAGVDENLYGLYMSDFNTLLAELKEQSRDLNHYKEMLLNLRWSSIYQRPVN